MQNKEKKKKRMAAEQMRLAAQNEVASDDEGGVFGKKLSEMNVGNSFGDSVFKEP